MITYPCGCINDRLESGLLRSILKCARHHRMRRLPSTLGEAYYREQGAFDGPHLEQIREALGPFPAAKGRQFALEIGCGCSPYAGSLKEAGWLYGGFDSSQWAATWTAGRWGVFAEVGDYDRSSWAKDFYGLILAAHVLEHLVDAPAGLAKMADSLAPRGELWLIVPDDSDPVNPDHEWFFSPETLRLEVERCGLEVTAMQVRKYIERERFIYCRAVKPA